MADISWNSPALANLVKDDVPAIMALLNAAVKWNPIDNTYGSMQNVPVGAKRITQLAGGYQIQSYNGSQWVSVGKLDHDAQSVDGYSAATGTTQGTIPVRNANGAIEGNITGNAATATSAGTLSATLGVSLGGTGATSAADARSNLGTPPTSHASTATTYGLSSDTKYGHAMAGGNNPAALGTASAGTDTTHFARQDHVHPTTGLLLTAGGTITGNLTVNGTLTATLTGNCTGSSSSCTGNAATASNSTKWNGAAKTVSTAAASGGANGDIWFQYI